MAGKSSSALMPLRVLEACVEKQSYERAAETLGVPIDALTHQLSAIEAWIGAPLFRGNARLIPIEATLYAKAILSDGFGKQRVVPALKISATQELISISTAPSLASSWLLPRLEDFHALNPGVDVWISVEMGLIDFSVAEADIALRYGSGFYPGLAALKLFDDRARVYASPALETVFGENAEAASLASAPLYHVRNDQSDAPTIDWPMWLAARGIRKAPRATTCASVSEAIAQAKASNGLVLLNDSIDPLATGLRSISLKDVAPRAIWAVWPSDRTLTAAAHSFLDWLRIEARAC